MGHGRGGGGEDPALYPLVAQHFERAGESAQAAEFWKRSGEVNARGGNNAIAIAAFENALALEVRGC